MTLAGQDTDRQCRARMTSAKGVVRDLEFSGPLVREASRLLVATLGAALDRASLPAPHQPEPPAPPKPTGAITCCGPGDGTRAGSTAGGMSVQAPPKKQPPVTVTGVAPWAQPAGWKPGRGADSVAGVGPLGLKGGMGRGFTGAGAGKPMTVAPWAQAPGSSISSVLAKVADSKSAMAHAAGTAVGNSSTSAQVDGAAAACAFVRDVLAAEECGSIAAALEADSASMQIVAAAAHQLVERLCALGGNSAAAVVPSELGAPSAVSPSAPILNDNEQEVLAKSLKSVLVTFYTRFPTLRAGLRQKVATCLVGEVYQCQQIKASSMGVRLHALDGGGRNATISLVGAVAALEIMTGIVRGLRKPLTSEQHLKLLWDGLLLLHEPSTMVDDRTPLLELFHKPLCLALVAFVEFAPQVATGLLRAVVTYWPTAASANSSKEVLLLHEVEMILDHCPPEALADISLRNLLVDTITSSFEGSKNFRVAERALLTFRSDGVLNVLRQHHQWCVSVLVPKLLQASTDHWNPSVLKLIGRNFQK